MSGWIGVDLDGTLAEYHGWVGIHYIGKPIPLMLERVKKWLSQGRDVRIFTARVAGEPKSAGPIREWCLEHLGQVLPITNCKDHQMAELWDDRVVQVVTNNGRRVDGKS
jgi:hypothetical protein